MGVDRHLRFSRHVLRSRRWPALRQQAIRRDNWQCVKCGARGQLEVDHVLPVRDHPELAFELSNLQTLCPRHHASKTRLECGHEPPHAERMKWLDLIRKLPSRKEPENA